MVNKWDKLARYFKESNASSADNVEITEPVLINELKKMKNIDLIDFGCGSGNFCKRISTFANTVLGVDSSEEMIKIARKNNSASNIEYTNERIYQLDMMKFNVLNAEYVIQFLTDEELKKLLKFISKSNIDKILIANDNLNFINESITQCMDKFAKDVNGFLIHLGNVSIRLYPRNIESLKDLFKESGFELEKIEELKYPEAFLKKFPELRKYPIYLPAYIVMVFKRIK